VLALETLVNGARNHGEPGIFVAFEENTEQIVANVSPIMSGVFLSGSVLIVRAARVSRRRHVTCLFGECR